MDENNTHQHKFQIEGTTWACWGQEDSCGLRAPACFTPKFEACTVKGQIDYIMTVSLAPIGF